MGKILDVLKQKDVGAIGIGAMIVFIAMVLVAGIAASVLIQTSTRLETQAMATGQETTAEVASGIAVVSIEGWADNSDDIARLAVLVRARAGSEEIDLNTCFIEISDTSEKLVLTYDQVQFVEQADINGNIFAPANYNNSAANEFSIIVVEDADDSCDPATPIINRGDKVYLTIDAADASGFAKIAERTDVWGMIVPEEGAPGIISFRTPDSFTDNVMELQ